MIISITGYSQINVHNVVNSYAVPYFQANVRVDDTLQTKTLLAIDGAVLFSGTSGVTPTSGSGTRFMWIPFLSAFRAGSINGTQWDAANIGLYSTAFGLSNKASGDFSNAGGSYTTANSYNLFTTGRYTDSSFATSRVAWVSTDPLFQVGNGAAFATMNDAFRILKNGKTYIGDASSATDAILIVDPTDSTSKFVGDIIQNGITNNTDTVIIADDSTLVFPNALKGSGNVWIFNASDSLVNMGTYGLSVDGTVYLAMNSGGITIVGTTDNKFNIFDNGTGHTYENKLGYSVTIMYEVKTW